MLTRGSSRKVLAETNSLFRFQSLQGFEQGYLKTPQLHKTVCHLGSLDAADAVSALDNLPNGCLDMVFRTCKSLIS